jgi:hypothetical protein
MNWRSKLRSLERKAEKTEQRISTGKVIVINEGEPEPDIPPGALLIILRVYPWEDAKESSQIETWELDEVAEIKRGRCRT